MKETTQRAFGFAAWIALAALQVVWHGWWLPSPALSRTGAVVLAGVPFLIPLLYWGRWERSLLLAGILSLFYFCHGVAVAWAVPGQRGFAVIEILLAVLVILACARMPRRRRAVGSESR